MPRYYNGQSYTFTWEKGRQLASAVTGGRSALDYLIKVKGIPFMQAARRIVGYTRIQPPKPK